MDAQIGTMSMTTEHSASSYGMPVLVSGDGGVVYGPDDDLDGFPAGSVVATVLADYRHHPAAPHTVDAYRLVIKWARQSPAHGPRWAMAYAESLGIYHPDHQ